MVSRGRKINLSPHQIAFHLKHAELGCPTFVLVQHYLPGATSAAKSRLLLYEGKQVAQLFERGVDVEPVAEWAMSSVNWSELRQRLSGRFDKH